jgi:ribosomal protein S1
MERMKEILQKEEFKPLKEGDVVEGIVIGKGQMILYLDLGKRTGVIYGREFLNSKDEIKKLKIGDKVFAKIVNLDNEDGFVELSLKGAKKEMLLKEFEKMKEEGQKLKVKFQRANRGGLLTKISGVSAFLPISQLSKKIEPERLKEFIGKEMEVKILSVMSSGQLILSQKLAEEEKEIEELKIGEIVEGEITGITDFGAFLKFKEKEGIIPLSEIPENSNLRLGERVKAKILKISKGKIFFSLNLS